MRLHGKELQSAAREFRSSGVIYLVDGTEVYPVPLTLYAALPEHLVERYEFYLQASQAHRAAERAGRRS